MALGINGVAAISGSFIGLVIGGVLAPINWHLIFLVSVPSAYSAPSGRISSCTTPASAQRPRWTGGQHHLRGPA